jgi:hypothetical protein
LKETEKIKGKGKGKGKATEVEEGKKLDAKTEDKGMNIEVILIFNF